MTSFNMHTNHLHNILIMISKISQTTFTRKYILSVFDFVWYNNINMIFLVFSRDKQLNDYYYAKQIDILLLSFKLAMLSRN